MQQNEFEQFSCIWSASWELVGKRVTPGQLDLAFELLKRFDLQNIKQAITAYLNDPDTGQFAPKPADIVRHIMGSKGTLSARAWSKVEKTIRCVGSGESIVFDDPIIHSVISDMGGWIGLCKIVDTELPFVAREFETRYRGYALQGIPAEWPNKLIGIVEAYNSTEGYKVKKPLFIGDQTRALKVFQKGIEGSILKITSAEGIIEKANQLLEKKPSEIDQR